MNKNKNLIKAKKEANNEFYTMLPDIENELKHYKNHFKDKIVYCNCDSPQSNFVKYFKDNFNELGLKDFYHSSYNMVTHEGSFDSSESIELLKKADIVVTNPPFSLFRNFIDLMFEYNKKFLVIGSQNAIAYKNCFKRIKDNEMWLGISYPKEFSQPDGSIKKFGNISWFTNLPHKKPNEPMILYRTYNEQDYPKYDNYEAIEVSKTKDIPKDYFKVIGVPITFLNNYCPEQFEIVDARDYAKYDKQKNKSTYLVKDADGAINGKNTYARILIKNKITNENFI